MKEFFSWFYDDNWGVTGLGFSLILITFLCLIFILADALTARSCSNYKEATGRDSKYIHFDACFVKSESGKWVRYDSNYKD